ncbi:DUF1003 domain-containing protein [Acinetobacter wuhouensis]|uniref:DUF1003 domain-containing protein n=1 Tax=Acinetobacter wuhouensis TaxID=1879050 RepID=A0A385C7Z9_9GAMM|nr:MULTISPECIES: DUF1003 domain-containing protein [Acinetobacter]AXQ23346.1 DUF1003 domain-containing protein [Acinetobacter wuhouensis]AYO55443.1 DUF1003 domain-containing protein [Acinetobacter wuhouensis]RZG46572.1 DUF1003 domain-containing protein [Acinetobacter wuhouensis]RZG72327.1 DUF1003 domain-containing protein [Acinetobacter wuhouensis]RZG75448.1 DUF1003 domain-containing protein [Acinetobacter sp. WCHAc060025]
MNGKIENHVCLVCKQSFPQHHLVPLGAIRSVIMEEIIKDYPDCSKQDFICKADLTKYRMQYVQTLLQSEQGEVSNLEYEVLNSMQQHELITKNTEGQVEQNWSLGERLADKIATFGGSWAFLICFTLFLTIWILVNTVVMVKQPADPYPFILLNLILSCLAAVQAPIIMMSQNRQEAKDRLRSQNDYQINLKAELEIRHLHEKIDHLLMHQWDKLAKIQEIQLDLLSEMSKKK